MRATDHRPSSPRCLPGSTHGHPREQPVGGLLGVTVAVFLGVAPVDDVLGPFGTSAILSSSAHSSSPSRCSSTLWRGASRSGSSRCPLYDRGDPRVGAITCLLSAFVLNTAMVAMLLPTAIGILSIIARLLHQRGDVL